MGTLEAAVLDRLWQRPDGATPAEVLAEVGEDLAYTTVMTILIRLWQKGLADRERRGRAYVYRPRMSEADFAAQRMQATLEHVRNRPEALRRFVDGLSASDSRVLRRLLEDPGSR